MKKHLFYASLFLAALSSCSKDDDRVSTPAGEVNNDLEEIKLAVTGAEAFNVQTRGTGVVGGLGTQEDPNNWNGQDLYIVMTDSGKVTPVEPDYTFVNPHAVPTKILWNVKVAAPTAAATGIVTGTENQPHYYYPTKGDFDFYGYHVDDACGYTTETTQEGTTNKTKNVPTPTVGTDNLTLDVAIDGSQDLMVAKADWNADLAKAAALQPPFNGLSWYPSADGYKYGAYAARRAVQPTLTFQHLLTQLQFEVENKSTENDITVKSITVTSKTDATMTVAGKNFSSIVWKKDTDGKFITAPLAVKQKPAKGNDLVDLVPVKLERVGSDEQDAKQSEKIGNLLVAASQKKADAEEGEMITEYKGTITLQQTLKATATKTTTTGEGESAETTTQDVLEEVTVEIPVDFTIALPQTSVHPNFLAGHAYNVKIYVYGLSLIKVSAKLTAWENGGGFEVTPEDQVNTGENATFTPTEDDLNAAWKFESTKLFNTLTGEKSFGEKSDTLLAYLASGYAISDEPITRAASTYTFKAFIEEFKAGEFEMTYFIDNGFTNENDEVTIESTISAKIEYTKNIQNGWVVRDRKTWEMLPSSYRKNYDGYPEPEDMPWLAVTYKDLEAEKVTVITPSGVTVELTGADWSVAKTNTLTTVKAAELKAVNAELPETLEDGVYTITIGTSTWQIEYKGE